jgi:D-threo-aldose 1-dehydrogenase
MERRRLGSSPVEVTTLSFGGAAIGGLFTPVSDADATAAVRRAQERGIGYFTPRRTTAPGAANAASAPL